MATGLRRRVLLVLAMLAVLPLAWWARGHFGYSERQAVVSTDIDTNGKKDELPQQYSDNDAGQVYRALIPATARASMLLVTATVQPSICSPEASDMPDSSFRDALANFRKTNARPWDVSRLIGIKQQISETARDSMFTRDPSSGKSDAMQGWNEFHRRYPDAEGILAVSAVGFDTGRTVAIVYSEVACGLLCGSGSFTCFRRSHDGWGRVEIPTCRWIA
jgi:hypothetical protein